jgi:hypothetical protein
MASQSKLDKEARTYADGSVMGEASINECIKARLAYPLLSQKALAQTIGLAETTVCKCLGTPYAKAQLEGYTERSIDTLKSKVIEAQYNAVEYYDKSIARGVVEIRKKVPLPQVLTNSRACADSISQVTGLLKTNVLQIQGNIGSPDEYSALPELEQDQDITAFLSDDTTPKET